ncbi:uncharacterized protein LOC119731750 [Patiria miniata]|uniref:receptor protein-tyrosine kinase n=1 Tax=Patiria miniata TaxID=46514 RepID=A0A914ABT3_PATMI|nr:uncharacterized protein LOC119731750 [Patiria miniata]
MKTLPVNVSSFSEGDSLRILPAENYPASIGVNVTFTCLITGHRTNVGPVTRVEWQKSSLILQRCSFQPPGDQDGFEEHCKLSIAPVKRTSAGQYKCVVYYLTSTTKTLQLDIVEPNTTVEVKDLNTGKLVDSDSEPICVRRSGSAVRGFKCTVRDAEPNAWNIAWFVGGERVVTGLVETAVGGLVKVSSTFNLSQSQTEFPNNLTCQATGLERLISITVELKSCQGIHPKHDLDLWDLSARRLVGLTSTPICIQLHTERTFQCQLRAARPGVWRVAWLIDGEESGDGFTNLTSSAGDGLVNVSSRFIISKWRDDGTITSLTCRATSEGENSLNVTVHLEICSDVDRVVNTSIHLVDLSTGELLGIKSGHICFKAGTKRTFACTILDARPDIVVTWIIDGIKNESGRVDVTPTTDGLFNMNTSFTVFNSLDGSLINSLTCMATGFKTESLFVTLQLQTCPEIVSNTSMELLDLSTGEFISEASEAICLTSETGRAFGCTVLQATPDSWRIVWVIDGVRVETGSVVQTPSSEELVDLFSRFTIPNPSSEDVVKSLTCRATSLEKEELAITVKLRSCADIKPASSTINMTMLFAIVGVLSGMLVLAVAALVISSTRAKRRYQVPVSAQSVPNLQGSVEMESVAPDSESDTTAVKEEVTYQNTIAQSNVTPEEISSDTGLPSWAEGWGIPWRDLIVEERVLGSGNFGEVRYGTVRKDGDLNKAAIKMLKGHVSACDRDDFMDELWTMARIGNHPNIVQLFGACQHQGVLYVALEYLPYGDLRSYLRTARSQSDSDEDALSSDQLVKFALDVARGMEHLAKAGVIHRDLAARNILIGNGLVAKVSDFGLSRGENIYVQTSRRRVPLRWLSIESVRHQLYTTQSDVWSFGILLWEIANFGGTPYPTISNDLLVETIRIGYRMPKPDNCDDQIYALMRDCWDEDPNNRPTFTDLVYILSDMADNRIKHTYMAVIRNEYQNMSAILPELDDN